MPEITDACSRRLSQVASWGHQPRSTRRRPSHRPLKRPRHRDHQRRSLAPCWGEGHAAANARAPTPNLPCTEVRLVEKVVFSAGCRALSVEPLGRKYSLALRTNIEEEFEILLAPKVIRIDIRLKVSAKSSYAILQYLPAHRWRPCPQDRRCRGIR